MLRDQPPHQAGVAEQVRADLALLESLRNMPSTRRAKSRRGCDAGSRIDSMGQAEIEGPHPAWSMRCFQAEVPLATRELREAWRRKGVRDAPPAKLTQSSGSVSSIVNASRATAALTDPAHGQGTPSRARSDGKRGLGFRRSRDGRAEGPSDDATSQQGAARGENKQVVRSVSSLVNASSATVSLIPDRLRASVVRWNFRSDPDQLGIGSLCGLRRSRAAPALANPKPQFRELGTALATPGWRQRDAPPPNLRRAPAIVPGKRGTNCKVDMRR